MDNNTRHGLNKAGETGKQHSLPPIAFAVCMFVSTLGLLGGLHPAASAEEPEQERVLACPYVTEQGPGFAGFTVHEHDALCFDADGNLVCRLPEIPYHEHDESCYRENRVLCCGLEESEGHVHTTECYDMTSLMITCGIPSGEGGHRHDDSCYETTLELACGLRETVLHEHDASCYDGSGRLICGLLELRRHQHGEDCFAEIIDDGETPLAMPETAFPAQSFSGSTATMQVYADADEGAFPAGTEMRVRDVEIEEALNAVNGTVTGEIVRVQAVEIVFFDREGNEIEPLIPIRVNMIPLVRTEADRQTVVRMERTGELSIVDQRDAAPKPDGSSAF